MMKNTLKLFILFLIILVIIIVLPSKKSKEDKKESITEQVISIPEPMLQRLVVYTKEGKIELIKEDERYKIVSTPYFAGPQEFSIFLGDINSIEGYKVKMIKEKGEEKTLLEVQFKDNTNKFVKIVGRSKFGKDSYFVETDRGFYQVEVEKIDRLLDFTVKKLRNHSITDFISDDIKEFFIDNICFYKDQNGKWVIKDYKEELDENKVFSAFAMATGLRAKEFMGSKDLKKYSLDIPIHRLFINKTDGSKISIVFSRKGDKYYGYTGSVGEVFEIHKTDWDILEKKREYYKKDKEDTKEQEKK